VISNSLLYLSSIYQRCGCGWDSGANYEAEKQSPTARVSLKLVFRCRARADVFGRLDHEVLHPAVERQPSRPTEPPRLVELGLLGERVVAQVDGLGLWLGQGLGLGWVREG